MFPVQNNHDPVTPPGRPRTAFPVRKTSGPGNPPGKAEFEQIGMFSCFPGFPCKGNPEPETGNASSSAATSTHPGSGQVPGQGYGPLRPNPERDRRRCVHLCHIRKRGFFERS